MAKAKLTQSQTKKLLIRIHHGGQANEVMGWLWLINALYWAIGLFAFSSPNSSNPIIALGSVLASFGSGIMTFFVILSVFLGLAYLIISICIKQMYGKVGLYLLIGSIGSGLFFMSIVPVIPALFSLSGYLALRKLERYSQAKLSTKLDQKPLKIRTIIAAMMVVVALILMVIGVFRLHQLKPKNTDNTQDHSKLIPVIESNGDYTTTHTVGHCAAETPISIGCTYTSSSDGYTVTFPSKGTLLGNPKVYYQSRTLFANNKASGRVTSSFTGYLVADLYFADVATSEIDITNRLTASVNDQLVNATCAYSSSSDAIKQAVTASNYNALPAITVTNTGIDTYTGHECHYYALAFMKGRTIYILSALDNAAHKDRLTQADLDKFVAGFHFDT